MTQENVNAPKPKKGAQEKDYDKIQEFSNELKIRNTRIKKVCKNTNISENKFFLPILYKKLKDKLFVDMNHNTTWCPVYKAASTTMMQVFAKFKGLWKKDKTLTIKNGMQLNKIIQSVDTLDSKSYQKIMTSTNKILVVRHPFERLLSAYRDKLEQRDNRKYYYEKYGQKIIKKYGDPNNQRVPTFTQFLKYISEDNYSRDEHWRPVATHCVPCLFPYDYVLKTESFDHEIKLLFKMLGMQKYLPETKLHVNQNGATSPQLANAYFSEVPKQLLKKLYNIYKNDFKLFNYAPDSYFNMTKLNS